MTVNEDVTLAFKEHNHGSVLGRWVSCMGVFLDESLEEVVDDGRGYWQEWANSAYFFSSPAIICSYIITEC